MHHDDDFMKSIPLFLRRTEGSATTAEAVPLTPVTATEEQVSPAPPGEALSNEAMDEPAVPPGKPGTLPWMARRETRVAAGAPRGHVPVPSPLPADSNGAAPPVESEEDQPQVRNFFRDTRVEIEQAFGDVSAKAHMPVVEKKALTATAEKVGDDTDAPFQVTLPRGVIRQIRLRAAEGGTTHRAIVLRALRGAGLAVPEGADVDRRVLAAKQRRRA